MRYLTELAQHNPWGFLTVVVLPALCAVLAWCVELTEDRGARREGPHAD